MTQANLPHDLKPRGDRTNGAGSGELLANLEALRSVVNGLLDGSNFLDGSLTDAEVNSAAAITTWQMAVKPLLKVPHLASQVSNGAGQITLEWGSPIYETMTGMRNASTPSRLIAPIAGVYRASVEVLDLNAALTGAIFYFYKNGSPFNNLRELTSNSAGTIRGAHRQIALNAGDYVHWVYDCYGPETLTQDIETEATLCWEGRIA